MVRDIKTNSFVYYEILSLSLFFFFFASTLKSCTCIFMTQSNINLRKSYF
jgi:hypothetical protein